MTLVTGLGTSAMIMSLTIALAGLPAQIYKNYKNKSSGGFSFILAYSACIAYTLWACYGWIKPDYFLAVSQTVGGFISYILVWQMHYYNHLDKLKTLRADHCIY